MPCNRSFSVSTFDCHSMPHLAPLPWILVSFLMMLFCLLIYSCFNIRMNMPLSSLSSSRPHLPMNW